MRRCKCKHMELRFMHLTAIVHSNTVHAWKWRSERGVINKGSSSSASEEISLTLSTSSSNCRKSARHIWFERNLHIATVICVCIFPAFVFSLQHLNVFEVLVMLINYSRLHCGLKHISVCVRSQNFCMHF